MAIGLEEKQRERCSWAVQGGVGRKVRERGAQSLRIRQEAWVFPDGVCGSEPGWVGHCCPALAHMQSQGAL